MDKETFDKKVAAIWTIYEAAQILNALGCATRVTNESTQALLRKVTAQLGDELANTIDQQPPKEYLTVVG